MLTGVRILRDLRFRSADRVIKGFEGFARVYVKNRHTGNIHGPDLNGPDLNGPDRARDLRELQAKKTPPEWGQEGI